MSRGLRAYPTASGGNPTADWKAAATRPRGYRKSPGFRPRILQTRF